MSRKKKYLLLIIFAIAAPRILLAQYAISGYIIDANSKETLIGANILHAESGKGTITNNNGFFSLTGLKSGMLELSISYVGYEKSTLEIEIKDKSLVLGEIPLQPSSVNIGEVSIIGMRPDIGSDKEVEVSHLKLTSKTLQSIPTARNDVFAAIKFLPGVDRTEPFSPLYTARGGDPGENAVLLDGVTIYNPYHSALTSGIFNALTIKNVDLLVGGFGAEFGGRNSSVMYLSTKDGNSSGFHGEVEPSTYHSKAFLEFPVGEKGSMVLAGRYYYDIPMQFIIQSTAYFYDFNISYTHRINPRNRITFKYFESKDQTGINFGTFYKYFGATFNTDLYDGFEMFQDNYWKNRAATVIHKAILGPRLYWRNQAYYSYHKSNNYSGLDFEMDFEDDSGDSVQFKWQTNTRLLSEITDLSFKSSLNYKMASFNSIHIGVEYNSYSFKNSAQINDVDNGGIKRSPDLLAFFIEDKLRMGPLTLRPGVRFSNYGKFGWLHEPRVNASIRLPWNITVKAAWGEYLQYLVSMNTNEVEFSQIVDYYYPLENFKPSKSTHYILGIEKALSPKSMVSLDLYYKDIQRIYTFDMNQSELEAFSFSNKLQQGSGEAYGLELMLRGNQKNLSGWIAYSLAWANRKYPHINNGEKYPFDYNRRHSFKTVINYQMTENFEFNTSFTYQSGFRRSIEGIAQSFYNYDPTGNSLGYFPMWLSTGKNNAKMPDLINLDFGIRKRLVSGFGKQLADAFNADESYLSVTIANVLFFRRNVEYYIPGGTIDRYYDKYIPLGSNYLPTIGFSYTIKF